MPLPERAKTPRRRCKGKLGPPLRSCLSSRFPQTRRVSENPAVMVFRFEDSGEIPNNPSLPLLIYKSAVNIAGRDPAEAFEASFPKGGWYPAWRWGVYEFPHYHSTAHEVLGVCRGTASIRLGHAKGVTIVVEPGDAIVIPAGVGHENLGSSKDFHVVGGYPNAQSPDLMRGLAGERPAADKNIAAVPLPAGDPLFGSDGPLRQHWRLAD